MTTAEQKSKEMSVCISLYRNNKFYCSTTMTTRPIPVGSRSWILWLRAVLPNRGSGVYYVITRTIKDEKPEVLEYSHEQVFNSNLPPRVCS